MSAKIERVTKYRSADGQEFDTESEAKKHNLDFEFSGKLKDILSSALATGRHSAILAAMLVSHVEIRDILNSYRNRLPKSFKVPAKEDSPE